MDINVPYMDINSPYMDINAPYMGTYVTLFLSHLT